jgi:hypothetical protein
MKLYAVLPDNVKGSRNAELLADHASRGASVSVSAAEQGGLAPEYADGESGSFQRGTAPLK